MIVMLVTTSFIFKGDTTETLPTSTLVVTDVYDVEPYLPWQSSGSGYWTESTNYYIYNDFDFMVSRSVKPIGGYYYYDFWFFSQSYYWDGRESSYTSTNLRNINIYVNKVNITSDYSSVGVTFNQTFNATSLRFRSKAYQPNIYIKWDYMKAK